MRAPRPHPISHSQRPGGAGANGIIDPMSTKATYDDANLILKLFELRRDEKLREARDWFARNFKFTTMEEVQAQAPPGSDENAYIRMVCGYWEMACSFVTSGVLNQDLFFESNGELMVVWERLREIVPAFRALTKNPSRSKISRSSATTTSSGCRPRDRKHTRRSRQW
jgi:hypothetical protein